MKYNRKIIYTICLSLSFLLFFESTVFGQIIKHFETIEKSNDSTKTLVFFKKIDKKIKNRLDSFYYLINEKEKIAKLELEPFYKDSGYVSINFSKNTSTGNLNLYITWYNTYNHYLLATNKDENYQGLFGYTFYDKKLILLNSSYSNFRVKDKNFKTVNNLILKKLTKSVRDDIKNNLETYEVSSSDVTKKYIIQSNH